MAILTRPVERLLYTRGGSFIQPIIVEHRRPAELLEELSRSQVFAFIRSLRARLGLNESVFFFPRIIKRFNLVAIPATVSFIEDLADRREVGKIYIDRMIRALQLPTVPSDGVYMARDKRTIYYTSTYWSTRVVGADKARQMGVTGARVTVSVIDTTAVPEHPTLRGAAWATAYPGVLTDANGHGVWCAGAIAGSLAYAQNIPVEGGAPGVRLLLYKGLVTPVGIGFQSALIDAMAHSVISFGAKVVSMSLGSDDAPTNPEDDAQVVVLERLTRENGAIFCVAAGNSGPDSGTINTPGIAESALTVGAYNPVTGELSAFSSRGPTPDGRVKPDCVMPGENILGPTAGMLDVATRPRAPPLYAVLSGTSMATPHASMMCALIVDHAARHGIDVTVDMIKDVLRHYGEYPGELKNNEFGWGVLTWDKWLTYAREVLGIV